MSLNTPMAIVPLLLLATHSDAQDKSRTVTHSHATSDTYPAVCVRFGLSMEPMKEPLSPTQKLHTAPVWHRFPLLNVVFLLN